MSKRKSSNSSKKIKKDQDKLLYGLFKVPEKPKYIPKKSHLSDAVRKALKIKRGRDRKNYSITINKEGAKCYDTLRPRNHTAKAKKKEISQTRASTACDSYSGSKKSHTPIPHINVSHYKYIEHKKASKYAVSSKHCIPKIGSNKINIEVENGFKKFFETRNAKANNLNGVPNSSLNKKGRRVSKVVKTDKNLRRRQLIGNFSRHL